jgi:outer membrane biogenesis lipoprotein LolB
LPAPALLLLAGCATPGFLLPAQDVEFEFSGRIAVRYRDDAGSGNISWRHAARSDELLLTFAHRPGRARLVRTEGEIMLTMQDGREHKAADAEALTEQVLGLPRADRQGSPTGCAAGRRRDRRRRRRGRQPIALAA